MNYLNKIKQSAITVFCIANFLCQGQSQKSGICTLGDIVNESQIPKIDSLELDSSKKDIEKFKKSIHQLSSLQHLKLKGETKQEEWSGLFKIIKLQPTITSIEFDNNNIESIPYGFEHLFRIKNLSIINNNILNYSILAKQLDEFPNLEKLNIEINSILDLPYTFHELNNLTNLVLINKTINTTNSTASFVYDYRISNDTGQDVLLKYISKNELNTEEKKEFEKRFVHRQKNISQTNELNPIYSESFRPKYKNITPPIKGIDVERISYTINPTIENVINYPSGTKILIPANSFVDSKGNTVEGDVTINYREFRNPVEILVSGIPMKYDSAGQSNDFESAGMFEITASINNEELILANNKRIDLNFATTSKDSSYNFYFFDDKAGNWEYLRKPSQVTTQNKIKPRKISGAYRQFRYLLGTRPFVPDSTSFAQRFESNEYAYYYKIDSAKAKAKFYYPKEKSILASRLIKINRVRKIKDGTILFKIRFNKHAHPELNQFNDVYFSCTDNLSLQEFKDKYVSHKSYCDIRLKNDGTGIELILKGFKKTQTINAELKRHDNNEKLNSLTAKESNKKMKIYFRMLKHREHQFNKKSTDNTQIYNLVELKDPEKIKKYAYQQVKSMMNEEEKKLSYKAWLTYYNQIIADEQAAIGSTSATASNLIQSLTIDNMGIFNCDQIFRIKNPVEIFASYKTEEGKPVKANFVYLIDRQVNGVFTYSPEKIKFSNSTNASNILIAVHDEGKISIYTTEKFKENKFENKSRVNLALKQIDSQFTNVADLRKIMGL